MNPAANIVLLTGAGISAESGLPTFRDKDGLWEGHRVEEVATPEAFLANPRLVHQFYNLRRAALAGVSPNPAHLAIAHLQEVHSGEVTVITQNIDDLHERAGTSGVIHMHGELLKAFCTHCDWHGSRETEMSTETPCPQCGLPGKLRPDIVWFGEIPYRMDEIESVLENADLFVSIGTSGQVYPAAGFVKIASSTGASTLEINSLSTTISGNFLKHITGPASETVPAWVAEIS